MTIKFHRPVYDENIKEGDIRTMSDTLEYYFVSHNFANYCTEEEPVQVVKEVKHKVKKTKAAS